MKKFVQRCASGGWLVALLGVLGFAASCDKSNGGSGNFRDEYGTPSADYEVIGSVRLSGTDRAVGGVQVRVLSKGPDGKYYSSQYLPVTATSENGRFTIQQQQFPLKNVVVPLEFSKQDEILTDTLDVSFEGVALSGSSGSWYEGKASKTIEVELDPLPTPGSSVNP